VETRNTRTRNDEMTNADTVKLKLVAALIEAIDLEDEDDAKAAIKTIKTLLGVVEAK
jgi:hypothetical protein